MKRKKSIISILILLSMVVLFPACTDWLDTQPNDKQSEEQQFADKNGFYAAVNGVYSRMSGSSLYGNYLSYMTLDLLGQCYTVEQTDQDSYYEYLRALTNWNYSNETVVGVLSSIWNEAYSTIMNVNVILKNIEEDAAAITQVLPERDYKMLKGEMLAARAMLHFDMLRLFGPIYSKNPEGRGIPYNESTDVQILSILPANDVLKNYILRDLVAAEKLLLESDPVLTEGPRAEYDEVDFDNSMRYRQLRLNYYATVLLTARAYLWQGDMTNALTEARKLTDDPKVTEFFPPVDPARLLANTSDPDRMFSTEVLFGYYNKDRGLIYDRNFGGPNTAKKLLIPRADYVDMKLFGGGDARDYRYQSQWESGLTLESNISKQLIKFKDIDDEGKDAATGDQNKDDSAVLAAQKFYGSFCSLIKLSEAYYIAAEALGTSTSEVYDATQAWQYLNAMRANRGTVALSGDEAKFMDALTKEYIREYIGEGQIFFYFKRLNKGFDADYNGCKATFTKPGVMGSSYTTTKDERTDEEKAEDYVAPLPNNELDNR